jgi:hypothetical protein
LKKLTEEMGYEEVKEELMSRFFHTEDERHKMICPVCGLHSIVFDSFETYETGTEHCFDVNCEDGYRPLRPTLVCCNKICRAYGKGFWSESELGWYSFYKDNEKLIGEPLPYSWYPADIQWRKDYIRFEYRKGVYIGPNRISKAFKFYQERIYVYRWRIPWFLKWTSNRCFHTAYILPDYYDDAMVKKMKYFSNKHFHTKYELPEHYIRFRERQRETKKFKKGVKVEI